MNVQSARRYRRSFLTNNGLILLHRSDRTLGFESVGGKLLLAGADRHCAHKQCRAANDQRSHPGRKHEAQARRGSQQHNDQPGKHHGPTGRHRSPTGRGRVNGFARFGFGQARFSGEKEQHSLRQLMAGESSCLRA